jgi:hypothetical protein
MAYIGYNPSQLAVAPFAVKSFTGDGSTTTFTLDQSVPGANEANVEVVVENVQQNPIDAYTIGGALNNSLIFSEAPVSGAAIYVIHKGEATYNLQPSTGSVTAATLDPVLRNFTVDNFTGNGSTTTYTLTDTPYSANSILVTVDGIVQTASTNYTVSGTTLSFGSSAPDTGAVITVVHLGFSSGNKAVMDGSITPVKLSTGGPKWDTSGNFSVGTSSPSYTSANRNVIAVNGTNSSILGLMSGGTARGYVYADATDTVLWSEGTRNLTIGTASAGPIALTTNNIERVRIDSRGKVGIGNSAPSNWKSNWPALDIGQAASFYSQDNTTTGIGSNLYFTGSVWGRKALGAAALYQLSEGVHYWYSNPTGAADSTFSPNTVMQLETNGQLTLPYGQIKFPVAQNASSDPNTLDDYEEGTWTPSIGGTATYIAQKGLYTKVGRMVTIVYDMTINVIGTGATSYIVGIPFAPNNSLGDMARMGGPCVAWFQGLSSNVINLGGGIDSTASFIYLASMTASANGMTATANVLTSGSRVAGTLTYQTT